MSPIFYSPDGRVMFALETPGEGDGNSVVYYDGVPVWDRFSHEARHGVPPPAPVRPTPDAPPVPPVAPLGGAPRVIRVTDDSHPTVVNRGYAYWSQAYLSGAHIYAFVGHDDGFVRFYRVNVGGGHVEGLGTILPYRGTGEGWYWDLEGRVSLCDGPYLRRLSPFTGEDSVVMDISGSHPGCILWQAHSSEDGQTHSATVRRVVNDGAYPKLGTVVQRHGRQMFFDAKGDLDESIVSRDGRWVIIQENHGNRIIHLDSRETHVISDGNRAVAHCDTGPSYVVGEADKPDPGACVLWHLDRLNEGPTILYETLNMGHVSVRGGRCLVSDHTIIGLVSLDGAGVTPLLAHAMAGSGYDFQVHANLSPCGRIAAYVSNAAGRMDLYVLVIP